MRIPGVVWSGLMVALPLLAVWLETYFGNYGWAPSLAGLLLIIVKTLEVTRPQHAPPPGVNAALPPKRPSRAREWLVG